MTTNTCAFCRKEIKEGFWMELGVKTNRYEGLPTTILKVHTECWDKGLGIILDN